MGREKNVSTKEELRLAAKERYDVIHLRGSLAVELANEAENYRKGDIIANVGLVAGLLFWTPAFFAGIAGKIATHDLKQYKLIEDENDYRLVLKQ